MQRFELLIPPPLVVLLIGLLMWILAEMVPGLTVIWHGRIVVAAAIGLLGLAISLAAVLTFKQAGTTTNPKHPAKASILISSGIYRYSRNPMYLGVLLVLIGWAIYLSNLLAILCIVAFVAYITRFQIMPEERLLREKFEAEFLSYKAKVRRWL